MNAKAADPMSTDFSTEELALLARFAEVTPLFGLAEPELDDAGWNAVFNGLMARGVIEPRTGGDGELGVGFAEGYAPLLGVALLATRATSLRFRQTDQQAVLTFLREPEVAVLHELTDQGLHRFSPIAADSVPARVAELVRGALSPADDDAGSVGQLVRVTTDDYLQALDALDASGIDVALQALPAAADYLRAVDAARGSISVADWILQDDGRLVGEVLSLLDGGGGLWVADQDELSVVLEPAARGDVLARVAAVVD
ncbi:MAG: hypothetical protein JHD16_17095 [Solirubrobacteraceae bacterium]|nr:hypothetical protein [Solirubrobacteraceae bacterium]